MKRPILMFTVLAVLLALLRIFTSTAVPPASFSVRAETDCTVWGRVTPPPAAARLTYTVPLEVESISLGSARRLAAGKVLLVLAGHGRSLFTGDLVCVRGVLSAAATRKGRQELDMASAQAYLRATAPTIFLGVRGGGAHRLAAQLRGQAEDVLERRLSARTAALAAAKILGHRRALSPEVKAAYRDSGVFHVLAISGLHLGILMLTLSTLLSWLGVPISPRAICVIVVAIAYAVLVDLRPPVLRAATMAVVVQGAALCRRRPDSLTAMQVALALCLTLEPRWLLAPELQLSFIAVTAILLHARSHDPDRDIARLLMPRPRPGVNHVRQVLSITMAVTVLTEPIVAFHFQRLGLAALIGNLLVVPFSSANLVASWVTLLPGVGWIAAPVAEVTSAIELFLATCTAALPGLTTIVCSPPWFEVVAYYLLVGAAFFLARRRRQVALLIALSFWVLWLARSPEEGVFEVETSSGAATIVCTATGVQVLDRGASPRRVARALVERGVDCVSFLLATRWSEQTWRQDLERERIALQSSATLPRTDQAIRAAHARLVGMR